MDKFTFDHKYELHPVLYRHGLVCLSRLNSGRKREDLVKEAQKKRFYTIKRSQVRGALINLWDNRQKGGGWRVMFLTFTFAYDPDEKTAARIWSNFLKNFKLQYGVRNYVWVKEFQPQSGRLHYHVVIEVRRFNISRLQSSFNSAVNNTDRRGVTSNNSVRLGNKPILHSIGATARYLSKYMAKEQGSFEQKAYGFTIEVSEYKRVIDIDELEKIVEQFGKVHIYSERFYSLWRVKDYFDTGQYREHFAQYAYNPSTNN